MHLYLDKTLLKEELEMLLPLRELWMSWLCMYICVMSPPKSDGLAGHLRLCELFPKWTSRLCICKYANPPQLIAHPAEHSQTERSLCMSKDVIG